MRSNWIVALVFCVVQHGLAQEQLRFEVASVKPSPPPPASPFNAHAGIRINAAVAEFDGLSLLDLAAYAFRAQSFQISGSGMNVRFDIRAKLPDGVTAQQVPEMLRQLLVDRFHMKFRQEYKDFDVFVLLTAPGGAKLRPRPEGFDRAANPGFSSLTVARYAEAIAPYFERPLIDMTELTGEYLFSRDEITGGGAITQQMIERYVALSAQQTMPVAPLDRSGLTRILKNLGLNVERRITSLPMFVIESIDKMPTED